MVIGVGYSNYVSDHKIVAIVPPEAAPIKRLIRESKKANMLIDGTAGHKSRSVIITDDGHVILSAVLPETIVKRCNKIDKPI